MEEGAAKTLASQAPTLCPAGDGRGRPKVQAGGAAKAQATSGAPLPETRLLWSELTCGDRRFVFNRELRVRVTNEDGAWVFESDEPDLAELVGFDLQYSGAEASFRQTFVACWDVIAQEDDERLASDARRLKRALLSLAKET
jgi:hypothetical protein